MGWSEARPVCIVRYLRPKRLVKRVAEEIAREGGRKAITWLGTRVPRIEQALAADGAIACFSRSFFPFSLNDDCAPQLKAQR